MSNDIHRAYSSVAVVLAIGAIGGMALVGYASKPHAAAPIVITVPAPAPVFQAAAPAPAPAPVAAAPAPAPVKAAAAPVRKAKRKTAVLSRPSAIVFYAVPRCSCAAW